MALSNMKAQPMANPPQQFQPLPIDPLNLNKGQGIQVGANTTSLDPEAAFHDLLQKIYDKIKAEGQQIIADMQKAQAIAATKLPDGSPADQPSSDCLNALIPIIQLIVNNQIVAQGVTPAEGTQPKGQESTPDGMITAFVKIRVVMNAITSSSVQKGCSWLQQTIQQAGTQGVANILGGILGVTKVAGMFGIP